MKQQKIFPEVQTGTAALPLPLESLFFGKMMKIIKFNKDMSKS